MPAGVRAVAHDRADLDRQLAGARPFRDGLQIAAAAGDQDHDRHAGAGRAHRRSRLRGRRGALRRPASRVSPASRRISSALVGIRGGHADRHAEAAVERAIHFVALDVACALQPVEHRWRGQRRSSITASRPFRQHARNVARRAAAGDVRNRVHRHLGEQLQHRLDVDARRARAAGRTATRRPASVSGRRRSSRAACGSASNRSSAARRRRGR